MSGGGEMGKLIREMDWSQTPVGPVETWPQSLNTAVSICLGSRYPIVIWWGEHALTQFYNDAYISFLGAGKHPGGLGQSARECWSEIWHIIDPMLEGVFATGEATWSEDFLYVIARNLPREEGYFTFSYSPIRDDSGAVGGIFCACYETTGRVIGERRLQTLRDLGRTAMEAKAVEEACEITARTLASNPADIPFALIYLLDDGARRARLVATTGLEAGSAAAPDSIDLSEETEQAATWPLRQALDTFAVELVSDLKARFGQLPGGAWPESSDAALILPVASPGQAQPTGLLVAGLSPRRVVDADYRSFFDLIAGHLATSIANARAYEEERKRAEALAEIDRAKIAFFSNVSHEFRTPLTLMLGPLEDMLAEDGLPPGAQERLEVARRNSLRLLKLVNSLLDFSRIEAGRIQAVYEPIDLAAFTADLASVFRSAVERAGMKLIVDCSPIEEPVYVDREMWEKIVLNLLSNAFKFTFEGEIEVRLRISDCEFRIEEGRKVKRAGKRQKKKSAIRNPQSATLTVRDTGTGIPAEELPHLFERFHRVNGARGRSYEGSGIGLALVQELVKLHGGGVRVSSEVDRGSEFIVSIPTGSSHLPADRVCAARSLASTGLRGEAYVEEALLWLPSEEVGTRGQGDKETRRETENLLDSLSPPPLVSPSRILLADDNADMREYVRRLLSGRYEVVAVADGDAALEAARRRPFDLVLTDVMMPRLDGFGLLKALRADESTAKTPVILLSARAGEESRVEGIEAGADDYLIKPFAARELLARVESHLKLARLRREEEDRAAADLRAMERLREVGNFCSRAWRNFEQCLNEIVAAAIAVTGADKGNLQLLDAEAGTLRIAAQHGFAAPFLEPFARVSAGEAAACGTALRAGGRVVVEDVRRSEIFAGQPSLDAFLEAGVSALQSTPLVSSSGQVFGMISTHFREPRRFAERELRLLDLLALQTADFLERRRALAALGESEARLSAVLQQLPVGLGVMDRNGRLTMSNAIMRAFVAEKIPSRDPRQMSRWRAFDEVGNPIPPDEWPAARALRGQTVSPGMEMSYTADGGREIWTRVNSAPLRDGAGEIIGAIVVIEDVNERKLAEEALRESEERFRNLADNMSQFAWIADAKGWIFWYNRRWYDYTGTTLEEMQGWGWKKVHHPDHVDRVVERIQRSWDTGEEWEDTFPLRGKDGDYRWFLSRAVPIRDVEGKIIRWYGANTDITEQRQAGQDAAFLSELAERIRLADDPDGLMWDVAQSAGGHLQLARCCFIEIDVANDRGVVRRDYCRGVESIAGEYRISDYSPSAMSEMNAGRTVVNRDSQTDSRTAALYETTYRKAGERAYVAVPLKRAGRWVATLWASVERPRDWTAREITLLEAVAERTWLAVEKLQSEQALRQSETRYRATFDNAAVGIAHVGLDGRWLRFNDAVCDITGYSREELLTKTFADITHRDDIDADWEQARRVLASEIPTYSMEKRYVRKDGSIVWIYLTVSLMSDGAGAPQNFISVIEDISDRKQAEEKIARLLAEEHRLREMAEQATRAKDEFLAVVSHELRSPLNAILGWNNLLDSKYGDDPQIAKATQTIERSGKAQLQLIEDLLDMTRVITGKMKLESRPVELENVITSALDTVRPAADNKGIAITMSIDPKAGQITGDPDRLQQVVWNLLSNAIKFTPEGGRVWVELRRGDAGVQILVRDTGQGIAPNLLPYVFDRFKQGDASAARRFGGLGLGLALAKHLVELHGGGVAVESPGESRGATFTVNLPIRAVRGDSGTEERRDGKAAPDQFTRRRPRAPMLEGVRALVVDDEADARELLTATLEMHGVLVTSANSTDAALAEIEARLGDSGVEPFDVLISDIGMPGADGYELIRRVRAHPDDRVSRLRGVALTAYARSDDRLRSLRAGFYMHVPKPVDEEELTTVIAALMGGPLR